MHSKRKIEFEQSVLDKHEFLVLIRILDRPAFILRIGCPSQRRQFRTDNTQRTSSLPTFAILFFLFPSFVRNSAAVSPTPGIKFVSVFVSNLASRFPTAKTPL